MYLYSYIIGVGIRITRRRCLRQPFSLLTCVDFEGIINRCIAIMNSGIPITENRIYEKKSGHSEISECPLICI